MKNVVITVLAILVLGLGGYLVYDKVINKKECVDNPKVENNETPTKSEKYQVLELSPVGGLAVLYNEEVYAFVHDSREIIDELYGEGTFDKFVDVKGNYKSSNFGSLEVVKDKNEWLKLDASNVKKIYNNKYGQDIYQKNSKYGIIILHNDNTVSYIGINNLINGNTKTAKLDISDVSSVVTENNYGYTTYLVKSNGTKVDVNTLIK